MNWTDKMKCQSKEELINRISLLIQKNENQKIQLTQQQSALVKYRLKLKAYEERLDKSTFKKKNKRLQKLNRDEKLMLNYRSEIRALKVEIDNWKERFSVCLEKLSNQD